MRLNSIDPQAPVAALRFTFNAAASVSRRARQHDCVTPDCTATKRWRNYCVRVRSTYSAGLQVDRSDVQKLRAKGATRPTCDMRWPRKNNHSS